MSLSQRSCLLHLVPFPHVFGDHLLCWGYREGGWGSTDEEDTMLALASSVVGQGSRTEEDRMAVQQGSPALPTSVFRVLAAGKQGLSLYHGNWQRLQQIWPWLLNIYQHTPGVYNLPRRGKGFVCFGVFGEATKEW